MEFNELLAHFENVKQEGGSQWRANCPACGDKKRHLYIALAPDGKALLDCKKGCVFGDIVKAAGLKQSDCFTPKSQPWKLLREHFYTSVAGEILAKKQIYDTGGGKKQAVWYRLEKGQYLKGLNGAKMPLYHLDRLVKSGGTVVAVEGEKDVETVERLGFAATTSPNGAGSKWRAEFNEFFRGKNVVIIMDNDEVGEKYGASVAEQIRKTAAAVKLIRSAEIYPSVKPKGDISDIAAEVGDAEARAWKAKRSEIQDRDLHMCRVCLSAGDYRRRDTSVHHIVPLTANWSKRLDNSNLITLCDYHHELAENGKIPAECLRALATIPPEDKPRIF